MLASGPQKWPGRRAARQRIDWIVKAECQNAEHNTLNEYAPTADTINARAKSDLSNLPKSIGHDKTSFRSASDVVLHRRPAILSEIEKLMYFLHRKDEGMFILTELCELDLQNQVIEFSDVIELYYKQFLLHDLCCEDVQHGGGRVVYRNGNRVVLDCKGSVRSEGRDGELAYDDSRCYAFRIIAEPFQSAVNKYGRLLHRGQGLWSLFGYAMANERECAARTLLRAGASPMLFRESVFEFDFLDDENWTCARRLHRSDWVSVFLRENDVHRAYTLYLVKKILEMALELLELSNDGRPIGATRAKSHTFMLRAPSCGCHFTEVDFWKTFCVARNRISWQSLCPKCGQNLFPDDCPIANECIKAEESKKIFFADLPESRDGKTRAAKRLQQSDVDLGRRSSMSLEEVKSLNLGYTRPERQTRLGEAVQIGDVHRIRCLAKHGVDFNSVCNQYGQDAMTLAILISDVELRKDVVSFLIDECRVLQHTDSCEPSIRVGKSLEYIRLALARGDAVTAAKLRIQDELQQDVPISAETHLEILRTMRDGVSIRRIFSAWKLCSCEVLEEDSRSSAAAVRFQHLPLPQDLLNDGYEAIYIDGAFSEGFLQQVEEHYFGDLTSYPEKDTISMLRQATINNPAALLAMEMTLENRSRKVTSTEPQRIYYYDVDEHFSMVFEEALKRHWKSKQAATCCLKPQVLFYPHMRFLHYDQKDKSSAPHTDLSRTVEISDKSKLTSTHTFILYLRDEFNDSSSYDLDKTKNCQYECKQKENVSGNNDVSCDASGSTAASTHSEDRPDITPGSTRLLTSIVAPFEVLAEVIPKRGRLFLFPHHCPHEGVAVRESQHKLLLRGEVFIGNT